MPTYTIEMLWKCANCGASDLRGLTRHCTSCGKPKGEEDQEYFPDDISERAALSGEAAKKASAGPDYKCGYCTSDVLQPASNAFCSECGACRKDGKKWTAKVLSVREDLGSGLKTFRERREGVLFHVEPIFENDPFPVEKEALHAEDPFPRSSPPLNDGGARKSRDFPKAETASVPYREAAPGADKEEKVVWRKAKRFDLSKVDGRKLSIGITVSTGIFLVGAFLWALLHTHIVTAAVFSVSWEKRLLVERYSVHRHEDWDVPAGGFDVIDEGQRVHHYDHVLVGSHDESYPEEYACGQSCRTISGSCTTTPRNCASSKNGSATCTGGDRVCTPDRQECSTRYCTRTAHRTVNDYRDEPRYRTWHSYSIWEWAYHRTVRHVGSTFETSWPTDAEWQVRLSPGEQERASREEEYTTTFVEVGGKDRFVYHPKSELEFRDYPVGNVRKLRVNAIGSVEVVKDGEKP